MVEFFSSILALSIGVLLGAVFGGILGGREYTFSKDEWDSKELSFPLVEYISGYIPILAYDKIQHFLGGILAGLISLPFGFLFWVLWEVKDGLYSYTENNKVFGYNLGGDGFSIKDLIASSIGVLVGYLIC